MDFKPRSEEEATFVEIMTSLDATEAAKDFLAKRNKKNIPKKRISKKKADFTPSIFIERRNVTLEFK